MRKKKQEQEEGAGLTGKASPRITPVDIQAKEFRLAFRGYNERDVDAFLDEITEELGLYIEENRQLREGATGLREGATETRAAGAGATSAPGSQGSVVPFLNEEREFLQSLASLVQGHAETVREMARAHRERTSAAAPSAPVRVPDVPDVPQDPRGAVSDAPPPVVMPENTTAAVAGSDTSQDAAAPVEGSRPARSLRELFWGED